MKRSDQTRQEEEGRDLGPEDVRAEEGHPDLLRSDFRCRVSLQGTLRDDPAQLGKEHGAQDRGPDPGPARDRSALRPDQHDHEHEQHHDRARVDDHLQRRHEGRAEDEHDDGGGQEGDDEVQQRVHGAAPGDHHDRCGNRDDPAERECGVHGRRLRTSTGGRSFSASPLPLPLISMPETL